jgi:hypothetical protein
MVTRVYGGPSKPPTEIDFSPDDFRQIEDRCCVKFNDEHRRMIDDTVHEYMSLQSNAWQMPRPRAVKTIYVLIEKKRAELARALAPLTSGNMASNLQYHLQRAINACTNSADKDIRAYLSQLNDQLALLDKIVATATLALPPDGGGSSKSKDFFAHLVLGLAEVYALAGGKLNNSWDDKTGSYAAGRRFLDLVASVQAKLPEKYRADGTGLGKNIQRVLQEERPREDLPYRWSSSPALRDALMASPVSKRTRKSSNEGARTKPSRSKQRSRPST